MMSALQFSKSSFHTTLRSLYNYLVCNILTMSHIHDDALLTVLPVDMKGKFDRIICDPPFLSADCQTKGTTSTYGLFRITNGSGMH